MPCPQVSWGRGEDEEEGCCSEGMAGLSIQKHSQRAGELWQLWAAWRVQRTLMGQIRGCGEARQETLGEEELARFLEM